MLVMQEVGKEIKGYTELNGRTDSNMIDALNAMYNYGMTKEKLNAHMTSKELTLTPQTQGGQSIKVLRFGYRSPDETVLRSFGVKNRRQD